MLMLGRAEMTMSLTKAIIENILWDMDMTQEEGRLIIEFTDDNTDNDKGDVDENA